MASTYSDLKIELIANGEQSGSWGNTTNTNLGTALEEAITGRAEANFASDANLTLGYTDSNGSQAFRNLILNVTGTISATRDLIVPTINKQYIVENNTTGGQSIVVKTSAGTGVTVPNGVTAIVYADGTNVVSGFDYSPSLEIDTVNIDGGAIDGVTIGTNSAATEVQIDNININGNAITSTDTDGNIALTPDGTGEVDISKVDIDSGAIDGTTIGANSAAAGTFTQLNVEAQGEVRLEDSSGGEYVALRAPTTVSSNLTLTLPSADGSSGQALVTDASGNLSFSDAGIGFGKAIAAAFIFG